jgi:hypothetical protein
MSKIALSGNASGTGTFTIASPNSNTDRTLSLPDAAGEMYNQGNILGTVSESSGVPTGAIIESGSNANGEYVKYADGTMICTRNASIQFTAIGSAGEIALSHPAAFGSTANIFYIGWGAYLNGIENVSSRDDITEKGTVFQTSDTQWRGRVNTVWNGARSINFIAIGRWF